MENEIIEEVVEESSVSFSELLKPVYEAFKKNGEALNEQDNNALNDILSMIEQEVNIENYVQIMYMKGQTYEKEDNRNGARYCAMRLLWMRECYSKPKKRRPRYLDMFPYTFEDDVFVFIDKYTNFLDDTYKSINHKLLVISIVLFIIIIATLFFLLSVSLFLSVIEGAVLCGLNFWLQKKRLPEMFQKNQTNVIEKYVEEELQSFDRLYRI